MRYVFFTDVHEFGPHEMKVDWEFHENSFYLGDNVDLKCCKPKDIDAAKSRLLFYQNWFRTPVVLGNHELGSDNNDFIIHNGMLLTHGDYLFWDKARADAYRAQEPGLSFVKRWFYNLIFGIIAPKITRIVSVVPADALERAAMLAKELNCHTVICGHWHPATVEYIVYNGVRIIILPRGKTVIDL